MYYVSSGAASCLIRHNKLSNNNRRLKNDLDKQLPLLDQAETRHVYTT